MKARLSAQSLLWKLVFIHVKIGFVCIWIKTNFYNKDCALSLAFIMTFAVTRKWPFKWCNFAFVMSAQWIVGRQDWGELWMEKKLLYFHEKIPFPLSLIWWLFTNQVVWLDSGYKINRFQEVHYQPQASICDWCSYHVLTSSLRYQSTDPGKKWNLFVLHNNQDFWPYFVSEHHVAWAESKSFNQSCDALNYRIIRKNFTSNNFKTNLYSRRNFGPKNITACQSLHWLWFVIDFILARYPGFLSACFG